MPTKPTLDTAMSGFSQLFEAMKNQSTSWMNYINLQGQNGNFDILRILKSAFFMQALATRQLFLDYSDRTKIDLKELESFLEKNKSVLVYMAEDNINTTVTTQRLYLYGTDTVFYIDKKHRDEWFDISILTFDPSLLEGSIKKILHSWDNFKENHVQMETNQTELLVRNS